MNVMKLVVLTSTLYFSLFVSGCGSQSPQPSTLKSFPNPVFTADNPDPARRLGHDKFGTKIATFGNTVENEFVISAGPSSIWSPLHGPVDLGGSEAISVITLEFDVSSMPILEDEYPDFDGGMDHMGCSIVRDMGPNNEASFVVSVHYKVNGVPKSVSTTPIIFPDGTAPRYPASMDRGIVRLEGIRETGSVTELQVMIGQRESRRATGECYFRDGQSDFEWSRRVGGSNFQLRLKRLEIPYAINR